YDRVRLDLNVGEARYLSVEALIREQKKGREAGEALNLALLEKLFDMGRYVFLCSSGDWPPRLQGIWGGSWDPAWRGDYTLDANVNLAVSGGNLGAMHEAMGGYLRLVEGVVDDWRTNARNLYGCRGILAGTRTDGDHNLHTHHSVAFPGHFWVAGTEWMVLPLHEYYEVTGDEAFLRDHVLPLLKEIALFYEDFLTEFDDDGNYVFVPSYSPEHAPENADNATVLNATMDIAAAKETLTNLIEACEILGVEQENLPKWRAMLTKMPAYLVNDEGALKEWAHPDLDDDYDHRHLSHLYPLWPGH
ncbi:MAG: glycoside hydrolase family 95 protein, partial [bacterium]|nr:glycoside hydrolase family 95 protein [bacterium]